MTQRRPRKRNRRDDNRPTPHSRKSVVPILPAPATSNPPPVPTSIAATPQTPLPPPNTRTTAPTPSPQIVNLLDERTSPSPEPLPTALFRVISPSPEPLPRALFRVMRAAPGAAEVVEIFDSDDEATPCTKRPHVAPAPVSFPTNTDYDDVTLMSHVWRGRHDHTSLEGRGGSAGGVVADDVEIVGGKRGVRALVDYPHFRFQCAKVEFEDRSNRKMRRYCGRCFCYVCDVPARNCKTWSLHAGAVDWMEMWKEKRSEQLQKQQNQTRRECRERVSS